MSDLLKGNFTVKQKVTADEEKPDADRFKEEYRKKALESIGGSMVFVERQKLFWDGSEDDASEKQ